MNKKGMEWWQLLLIILAVVTLVVMLLAVKQAGNEVNLFTNWLKGVT